MKSGSNVIKLRIISQTIEDKKGSITAGKDAGFLVFENDLLTAEHEGFSYNMPCGVYFSVKKMN